MSVHGRHCCTQHGCKYGDEDCPVAITQEEQQEQACEDCEDYERTLKAIEDACFTQMVEVDFSNHPCCEAMRRLESSPGDATTLKGWWCPLHGIRGHLDAERKRLSH